MSEPESSRVDICEVLDDAAIQAYNNEDSDGVTIGRRIDIARAKLLNMIALVSEHRAEIEELRRFDRGAALEASLRYRERRTLASLLKLIDAISPEDD